VYAVSGPTGDIFYPCNPGVQIFGGAGFPTQHYSLYFNIHFINAGM